MAPGAEKSTTQSRTAGTRTRSRANARASSTATAAARCSSRTPLARSVSPSTVPARRLHTGERQGLKVTHNDLPLLCHLGTISDESNQQTLLAPRQLR